MLKRGQLCICWKVIKYSYKYTGKKAITLEITECPILGGKRSFLVSIKNINKYFFPDFLVGFLFANKGQGFTIAFLHRQMGYITATGIFLYDRIEERLSTAPL